jgi:hypothetical protein
VARDQRLSWCSQRAARCPRCVERWFRGA